MMQAMQEKERTCLSGFGALAVLVPLLLAFGYVIVRAAMHEQLMVLIPMILLELFVILLLCGLFMVQPNEGKVLQLFGRYVGTCKDAGLRWANPFYSKRAMSLRVRNFETPRLKVNDLDGNPVEIASVVVWRVVDTAEACFNVDSYENYVHVQSESAIRNLASRYPYDVHDEAQLSLRGHTLAVADHLKTEIHERVTSAGVQIMEARISHLAYAPEIAAVMLRRQQAAAIIAARQRIVEGAVSMVQMALAKLSADKVVELDEERKAAMVSNLLVVLCAEREAQPVVNAGTLYQ